MLHRTTWFAIPVVGLVVLGAGLGAWGYDQQRQRQALAQQVDAQYDGTFHNLVSNFESLHEELGKALLTGDPLSFQLRLRNVWRLTYASQTEEDRLPFDLSQMHNVQRFLATVRRDTENWMNTATPPSGAHRQLETLYSQSSALYGQLVQLQNTVFDGHHDWFAVSQALSQRKEPDAIVDGFKKMDATAGEFLKTDADPAAVARSRSAVTGGPAVSGRQAADALARFLGVNRRDDWQISQVRTGGQIPVYQITGATPDGNVHATVTQQGGHVLMFHIDHRVTSGDFDYVDAQERARQWLEARGFNNVELTSATQYDRTAYFIFTPTVQGAPVLGQGISVKVSLDNGHITDYEGTNYFLHPVRDVPPRRWTAQQLQHKLSPAFTVRMTREVVALDAQGRYQPAVAFYGTSHDDTYCVYMNANTGHELAVEKLTNHT